MTLCLWCTHGRSASTNAIPTVVGLLRKPQFCCASHLNFGLDKLKNIVVVVQRGNLF